MGANVQMKDIKEKAQFYSALGEPLRLQIIEYLLKLEGYSCVGELAKLFRKDQSVIYRHIEILQRVGLVDTKKEKKFLLCYIKDKDKWKKLI